jgi:hypothetical protein
MSLFIKIARGILFQIATPLCLATLSACGGGGDGETSDNPCNTLRIAGGDQCETRPVAVAAVVSQIGYCSGIFIANRQLITAAHCIPLTGREITVATKGFSAKSIRTRIHPFYAPGGLSPYDVAIITIGTDLPGSPAPLMVSRDVESGDAAVAYGYGIDENGDDVSDRVESGGYSLKATSLDVAGIDNQFIRTISNGEGDTCRGDSGGPILVKNAQGEYGIVGVVSFGPNRCETDLGFPSAITNLQSGVVRDFIANEVEGARFN